MVREQLEVSDACPRCPLRRATGDRCLSANRRPASSAEILISFSITPKMMRAGLAALETGVSNEEPPENTIANIFYDMITVRLEL